MVSAVSKLRFNRSAGMILASDTFADDTPNDRTPKWDYKILQSGGQRSIDTRTVVRDYDRAIARVLMQQFLHLGERSTGSFALSDDQSNLAVKALMAIAKKIADEWNLKLIPLMWEINGLDKRYMPRLRATNLSKDGIEQLGKFLAAAARAEKLWGPDKVLRGAMLRETNLAFDQQAQDDAAELFAERAAAPPVQPTFGQPGAVADPDPEKDPTDENP